MSPTDDHAAKGIDNRFRDLSADVREERLLRYVVHQVKNGRHVDDIVSDPYVAAHFDQAALSRALENPEVIRVLEEELRREFAGYGDAVGGPVAGGGEPNPAGKSDAELPDL
jgi:hypothetical protein